MKFPNVYSQKWHYTCIPYYIQFDFIDLPHIRGIIFVRSLQQGFLHTPYRSYPSDGEKCAVKSFKKHGLSEKRRGDLKNEAGYGNQKRGKETRGAINEQLRDPGKFRVLDLNLLMFDESVCVCVILWLDSFGGWILIFFTVTYIDLVECTVEVMFSFFGNITFGITASAIEDMDLIISYQWCRFITEFTFIGKSL